MSKVHWELKRLVVWLMNGLSNAMPDDYVGHRARRLLLRIAGVRIGRGTIIEGGSLILGPGLLIGEGCYVNRRCYFDLGAPIKINSNVSLGHGVTIITTSHEIGSKEKRAGATVCASVVIEAGCWVGANATIMPGVTIGHGSIVAAGSLVNRDVAENSIVAGVPAKFVKHLP